MSKSIPARSNLRTSFTSVNRIFVSCCQKKVMYNAVYSVESYLKKATGSEPQATLAHYLTCQ